ncbi:MAG: hypothetical protein ACTSXZ_04615, partial [Alphaproteobacteria bacterium]
ITGGCAQYSISFEDVFGSLGATHLVRFPYFEDAEVARANGQEVVVFRDEGGVAFEAALDGATYWITLPANGASPPPDEADEDEACGW